MMGRHNLPLRIVLATTVSLGQVLGHAQAEASTAADFASSGLHWIDGVIIAVYALGMISLGWYYRRRQKSLNEYFVGNRTMNPGLIGISMFVTLFSTISFLATPGEVYGKGPFILTSSLSIPFYYLIVGYLIVPAYMRFRLISAYELLEQKRGLSVRLLGAILFIMLRLTWMSLLIHLSAQAMLLMLGLEQDQLPYVALVIGAVAIIYASFGGLRAVVITDFVQFCLLCGGALLVVITVTIRLGGFGWFPTEWNSSWDTQPLFSLDPNVRLTVFGSILGGTLWWVCTAGGDQTAVQRFMATRDVRAARRSFLLNSAAGLLVSLILALVAFSLMGFFEARPELLPPGIGADRVFPHYIVHHLPIGISGLVVSGLFAAAMSSVDSGVNSLTAVVVTDFVGRFRRRAVSEIGRVRLSQALALAIGLVVVLGSSFLVGNVPGNFLEIAQRTLHLYVGAIFLLFFLSLFVPFSTALGVIAGSLSALLSAASVAYWGTLNQMTIDQGWIPLSERTGIVDFSFQWILPVSLSVGLTVGCLVSLIHRRLNSFDR
jgi:SSS family solute:Na+ symporter